MHGECRPGSIRCATLQRFLQFSGGLERLIHLVAAPAADRFVASGHSEDVDIVKGPPDRWRRAGRDHGCIGACATAGDLQNSLAHRFRGGVVLAP